MGAPTADGGAGTSCAARGGASLACTYRPGSSPCVARRLFVSLSQCGRTAPWRSLCPRAWWPLWCPSWWGTRRCRLGGAHSSLSPPLWWRIGIMVVRGRVGLVVHIRACHPLYGRERGGVGLVVHIEPITPLLDEAEEAETPRMAYRRCGARGLVRMPPGWRIAAGGHGVPRSFRMAYRRWGARGAASGSRCAFAIGCLKPQLWSRSFRLVTRVPLPWPWPIFICVRVGLTLRLRRLHQRPRRPHVAPTLFVAETA